MTNRKINKIFKQTARPYYPWIILDSMVKLANAAFAMVIPSIVEAVILGKQTFIIDVHFWWYYIMSGVMLSVGKVISGYIIKRKSNKMLRKFRSSLYESVLRYPLSFHKTITPSLIASSVMDDALVIKEYIFAELPDIFVNTITVACCVGFLFSIDPKIAAVMLAGIPISLLLLLPFKKMINVNSRNQKRLNAAAREYIVDNVTAIEQVKISCYENVEAKRGKQLFKSENRAVRRENIVQALLAPMSTILGLGLFLVVGGYAVKRIIDGYIALGSVIAFAMYFVAIITEVIKIVMAMVRRQKVMSAGARVARIYNLPEEKINSGEDVLQINELALVDVTFAYGDKVILDKINIKMSRGESYALMAASGGGKTTLLSLIERFYLPQSGKIMVNGESVDKYSIITYRRRICYLMQENVMIGDTLQDYLLYGAEIKHKSVDIDNAIEAMAMTEVVAGLALGINTPIVTVMKVLSGGQKQKLAIVRAMLDDFDILLMDEATSSMDIESESLVGNWIDSIRKDKIIIIIAHRLSTLKMTENVMIISEGEVFASGSHVNLSETCEKYTDIIKKMKEE